MKTTAALTLLLAAAAAAHAAPYGAGFYDTSEYLMGKVAVNVIFVQSDNTIDARTELNGWTAAKKNNVMNGVQSAMAWWAARNPAANLSFVFNNATVTTGYEPIARPSSDEDLWVTQVMGKMGYSEADYFDRVYHYDNDRRAAAGADWAFTIFMVDSEYDADGQFADNYFAYAYVGGPFMIMTYDNDGYGIGRLAAVNAHETGHIFYALDEYYDSGCAVTQHSGYLDGYNLNCDVSNTNAPPDCIMRGDTPPYDANLICTHTQKMLGWSDTNANGKLDILDQPPTTALTPFAPDPTTNTSPAYSGAAYSTAAYHNSNAYAFFGSPRTGNDITINRVASVEYRVDGGSWLAASASDGTYDSDHENYGFTASALGSGAHTIEARAKDIFGAYDATPAADSLTVNIGAAQDIPYVQDGAGDDVDYTRSKTTVSANWGPSSHASGINRYEYAIGTTPGSADVTGNAWTSAGTALAVTRTGLALAEGVQYYFSVIAYPNSGTPSGVTASDGFKVDVTSPTAKVELISSVPARTGPFSAKLIVAEANAVGGTPQLSFRTSGGLNVPMSLTFLTDSTWTAVANVESYHSTGTASFQFSGSDLAGNVGTALTSGGSFSINYALAGGSSGTVSNSDGDSAYLPTGSYSGTLFVSIATVPASALAAADAASGDSKKIYSSDLAREFTARNVSGVPVTTFSSPVTITLSYPDFDNDGRVDVDLLKENTLWLYYLDPSAGKWTPVPGVTRNPAANTLSADVSHFSIYSVRSMGSSEGGISSLKAYPNPCDFRKDAAFLISGLPVDAAGTRVHIYNEAGEQVRVLSYGDGVSPLNEISWDGRQKDGAKAASGLYVYLVKTTNYGKGSGKFFIIW